MSLTDVLAPNYARFRAAVADHDSRCESPAYGIGVCAFDLERLGLDEGEIVVPGITIHVVNINTGHLRVLCSAEHSPRPALAPAVSLDNELVAA